MEPVELAVPPEDGPTFRFVTRCRRSVGGYSDFVAVVFAPATADRRPEDRFRNTDLEVHQREPVRAGQHPEPVVFSAGLEKGDFELGENSKVISLLKIPHKGGRGGPVATFSDL